MNNLFMRQVFAIRFDVSSNRVKLTLEINCGLYIDYFFCSFSLANVLSIMDKDFPKKQVISPIWFGKTSKPMVFGPKLVTYQEPITNVRLHSKQMVPLISEEHLTAILEMLDNVPMLKGIVTHLKK